MTLMKDQDGVRISKNLIALITLLILLLGTMSSVVAYTVGVKSAVEELDNDMNEVKESLKELQPRISMNEKEIAVMQEHYKSIDLNIQYLREAFN